MAKEILSEELRRMQKLAGLLKEESNSLRYSISLQTEYGTLNDIEVYASNENEAFNKSLQKAEEAIYASKLGQIEVNESNPNLNERISFEAIERMEGFSNEQDLATLQAKLRILSSDWMQEGFEKEDIIDYLAYLVDNI